MRRFRSISLTSIDTAARLRTTGRHPGSFALVAAATVCAAAVLGAAIPAWAHVTVHPTSLPAGSQDVELVFRVPNERDDANTVELQVFFPTNLPLLTVDVLPVPGWSSTVHTVKLSRPVQTDDGPVSDVVSDVTWNATAGGISQGQYEDFPVSVGAMPGRPGQVVFKALQTYSSGEIVRWIEVPVAGRPEPDSPAPILTLTPAPASGRAGPRTDGSGSDTATALAIAALILAGAGVSGVAALFVRDRRRAR